MARIVIASLNVADSSDAVQMLSAKLQRVMAITLKARSGNVGGIYVADDSAAKSGGFELLANDREDWSFDSATVKGASFWVWGADSGDKLDYAVLLED